MDYPIESQTDQYVREKEEMFMQVLSPIEPLVMYMQSLLVWENPRTSAAMFILVHGVFWFVAANGCQFYFTISVITMILYMIYTWKRKIWPEIRVPPKIPEDPDSWTPVHPCLLSVPEICRYLAQLWCFLSNYINCWLAFRINHHILFCGMNCFGFLMMALVGRYVPGLMLTYIIVISAMLWPCFMYNNLLQKCYLQAEPIFMKLDYSLKLKPKWIFKEKKSTKRVDYGSVGIATEHSAETDSESEDFIPSHDPVVTAALARAITDSEDEGGTSMSPPGLSKEASVEINDDQDDRYSNSDIEAEFAKGLGEMPSIEDDLDHTDDELLGSLVSKPKKKSKHKPAQENPMNFISTHFGDSSDEEESLIKDLSFPDIHNDSSLSSVPAQENTQTAGSGFTQAAGDLVSRTFATVMDSAISGISNLKQKTVGDANRTRTDSESCVSFSKDEHDGDVDVKLDEKSDQSSSVNRKCSESSDVDITEDFEFLDEYEVEEDQGGSH